MKILRLSLCVVILAACVSGCQLKEDESSSTPGGKPLVPAPSDVAAAPANALKTPSGIASKVLTVGLGSIHPTAKSRVTVHYTGWTTDGKMFDTSQGGAPITFGLTDVIPGWTEALQLMVIGEKRRFWIPGNLAYDGQPDRPQGTLVFDIELIDIR